MEEKTKKVIKVSALVVLILLVFSVGIGFFTSLDNSGSSSASESLQGNIQLNILPSNSGEIIENENR